MSDEPNPYVCALCGYRYILHAEIIVHGRGVCRPCAQIVIMAMLALTFEAIDKVQDYHAH